MTPMQEITARMGNGDVAHVPIFRFSEGYRADIDYRVSSGPSFDPTEGPLCGSPSMAFDWMIGTVAAIAEVRSTQVTEIGNSCNTEFLPAEDQKGILQRRGVTARVLVNGQSV